MIVYLALLLFVVGCIMLGLRKKHDEKSKKFEQFTNAGAGLILFGILIFAFYNIV